MRPRSLLWLAIAVAALGGFVYFVERDLPTTEERKEREGRLLDVEADDVVRVELGFGDQRVVLERNPPTESEDEAAFPAVAEWRLVEPLQARADATAVTSLLRGVSGLQSVRTLEEASPAELGLAPPALRVGLTTSDGEELGLEVGDELPASTRRAVRGPEGSFELAEAVFFGQATRVAGEWRDRRLFPGSRAAIQSVRLEAPDRSVLLSRRGQRFWLESPLSDEASKGHVDGLLIALTGLEATSFLDREPDSAWGLDPASGVVEVVLEGEEEPFRLHLGALQGDTEGTETDSLAGSPGAGAKRARYGQVGESVFVAETDLGSYLERTADEWRSRSWLGTPSYDIDRLRITRGDEVVEVRRDGVDWRRGDDKIDYATAADLLADLSDLEALHLIDRDTALAAGHLATAPDLSIEATTREGTQQILTAYPVVETEVAAEVSGRDVVFLLPAEAYQSLGQAIDAVRDAEAEVEEQPVIEGESAEDEG